jgi:hypothetical protein
MSSPPHPFFFSFFLSPVSLVRPRRRVSLAPTAYCRRPARAGCVKAGRFSAATVRLGLYTTEHDGRLDGFSSTLGMRTADQTCRSPPHQAISARSNFARSIRSVFARRLWRCVRQRRSAQHLLFRRNQERTFLIDCGASGLIAMRRFGIDPNRIGTVFVSHLHADHFGGLPFLLLDAQLYSRRNAPLTLVGPPGFHRRLMEAMELFFPGSSTVQRKFSTEIREISVGETIQ